MWYTIDVLAAYNKLIELCTDLQQQCGWCQSIIAGHVTQLLYTLHSMRSMLHLAGLPAIVCDSE